MGNNTSSTNIPGASRKSTAGQRTVDKELGTQEDVVGFQNNLDEEFSDLILHPVKREDDEINNDIDHAPKRPHIPHPPHITPGQILTPHTTFAAVAAAFGPTSYLPNQFNEAIEDDFNELNQGFIETEATEISRNYLQEDVAEDNMELDPPPKLALATKVVTPDVNKLIPVEIKWVNVNKENINKISIIGSFSNWRDVLKLVASPFHDNEFITTLSLPLGVHKLLYIINNEYRVSDQLPTATDQEGIFFNWFEVIDDTHLFNHSLNQPNHLNALTDYDANIISSDFHHTFQSSTSMNQQQEYLAGKYDRKNNSFMTKSDLEHIEVVDTKFTDTEHLENAEDIPNEQSANYPYISDHPSTKYVPYNYSTSSSFRNQHSQVKQYTYSKEIPEMFVNYDFFKQKGDDYELPEPPQLPAHLNNVLLNKISQPNSTNPHLSHNPHSNNGDFRPPNASYGEQKRPGLRRADSSYYARNKEPSHLAVPNHVILNHLMTTSIRNEVLTVACITRYSGKFVTQIMHSPAE